MARTTQLSVIGDLPRVRLRVIQERPCRLAFLLALGADAASGVVAVQPDVDRVIARALAAPLRVAVARHRREDVGAVVPANKAERFALSLPTVVAVAGRNRCGLAAAALAEFHRQETITPGGQKTFYACVFQ